MHRTSTSMTPVRTDILSLVAEMNDIAVGFLKKSSNEEACRLFIDALELIDTNQRCQHQQVARPKDKVFPAEETCSSQFVTEERPAAAPSRVHHRHLLVGQPLSTCLPERSHQVNLPTGIYNHAFHILGGDTVTPGTTATTMRSVHLDVAVLSFNIALCYHLMGDNPHSLHRALVWYDQCTRHILLEEERRLVWGTPPDTIVDLNHQDRPASGSGDGRLLIALLAAALCHNVAAIHGDHMFDIPKARALRCQLAQVLHLEGRALLLMETDDFVFFHLGILFALLDDFQVAPAA